MSLRDRIAKTLHGISCSHLDIEVDWASEYEGVRARFYEDADAIISDPEVAALVRVGDFCLDTMFAPDDGGDAFRCAFCGCGERPVQFRPDFVHARNCALARLEEARRG